MTIILCKYTGNFCNYKDFPCKECAIYQALTDKQKKGIENGKYRLYLNK